VLPPKPSQTDGATGAGAGFCAGIFSFFAPAKPSETDGATGAGVGFGAGLGQRRPGVGRRYAALDLRPPPKSGNPGFLTALCSARTAASAPSSPEHDDSNKGHSQQGDQRNAPRNLTEICTCGHSSPPLFD